MARRCSRRRQLGWPQAPTRIWTSEQVHPAVEVRFSSSSGSLKMDGTNRRADAIWLPQPRPTSGRSAFTPRPPQGALPSEGCRRIRANGATTWAAPSVVRPEWFRPSLPVEAVMLLAPCANCGSHRLVALPGTPPGIPPEPPRTLRVIRLPESDDLVELRDAQVTEIEVWHDGTLTCVRCGAVCKNGRWGSATPGVKEAVREILEKLAELGLTITYKELSRTLKLRYGLDVNHRFGLVQPLLDLHADCVQNDEPSLPSLVVRADEPCLPGLGWWGLPGAPKGPPDYAEWKKVADAVWSYWMKKVHADKLRQEHIRKYGKDDAKK